MPIDVFERYAQIKNEISDLEAEAEDYKVEILRILRDEKLKSKVTDYGTFSTVTRKKWEFSEQVEEQRLALKEKEKEEMASGIATFTESESLMFKSMLGD